MSKHQFILSWDMVKMLTTMDSIINGDGERSALINWFGTDEWNELVKECEGDENEAMRYVKIAFQAAIDRSYKTICWIQEETKDNEIVQERLKAAGFPNGLKNEGFMLSL